jgi:hypothetical protein
MALRLFIAAMVLALFAILNVSAYTRKTSRNPSTYLKERDLPDEWYGIFLDTGGQITRFESTLIIPPYGGNIDPPTDSLKAIYPALDSGLGGGGLLQNVLTSMGPLYGNTPPGQWWLDPYFEPNNNKPPGNTFPGVNLVQVYPGQALTNIYTLDVVQQIYLVTWIIENGVAVGSNSSSGSFAFDTVHYLSEPEPPYQQAQFFVETHNAGLWDFGPFEWQNIIIESNTTETAWCTEWIVGPIGFTYLLPGAPSWSQTDGFTTCYVPLFVFLKPGT